MNHSSYFLNWIRSVILSGSVLFCLAPGALAQIEAQSVVQQRQQAHQVQPTQPVPYEDVLTSKMQKPLEEKSLAETDRAELRRIEGCSAQSHAKIRNAINLVCLMFLFGAFSAIWAQNTGRNPLLWFIAGACFNFVTILVILRKNARSRRKKRYRRNGAAYMDYAHFY